MQSRYSAQNPIVSDKGLTPIMPRPSENPFRIDELAGDVNLHLLAGSDPEMTAYHLPLSAPASNTTRTKRPVVSPEFVLFFPYPTAKVTVSFAFISSFPEYS